MATITTGLFFIGKTPPEASDTPEGFRLALHVIDRQGQHMKEAYVARWAGAEARAWWAAHRGSLVSGTPLQLTLENPRSYPGMRSTYTEARVVSCALAPLAPSWIKSAGTTQGQPA